MGYTSFIYILQIIISQFYIPVIEKYREGLLISFPSYMKFYNVRQII